MLRIVISEMTVDLVCLDVGLVGHASGFRVLVSRLLSGVSYNF